MRYSNPHGKVSVEIEKINIQEMGLFNPLYYRPYEIKADEETIEEFSEVIDNVNDGITSNALSGIASRIVKPSSRPGSMIHLPNGWNEPRYIFTLIVKVTTVTDNVYRLYIQGFTSHEGISNSLKIDPRMIFHATSVTRVSEVKRETATGYYWDNIVTQTYQVIDGRIHADYDDRNKEEIYLARPEDIFSHVHNNWIESAMRDGFSSNSKHLNTSLLLGDKAKQHRREDNIPSSYLSRIIDSYVREDQVSDFNVSSSSIFSGASSRAKNDNINLNPFFKLITDLGRGPDRSTSWTIETLRKIDANIDDRIDFMRAREASRVVSRQDDHNQWTGSDHTTVAASLIGNAVAAIMHKLLISKISFRCTNDNHGGKMSFAPTEVYSITGDDMSASTIDFERELESEILFDISFRNEEIYYLEGTFNLYRDSRFRLSFGGPPGEYDTFRLPQCIDAICPPVISTSKGHVSHMASGIESLLTTGLENKLENKSRSNIATGNFLNSVESF